MTRYELEWTIHSELRAPGGGTCIEEHWWRGHETGHKAIPSHPSAPKHRRAKRAPRNALKSAARGDQKPKRKAAQSAPRATLEGAQFAGQNQTPATPHGDTGTLVGKYFGRQHNTLKFDQDHTFALERHDCPRLVFADMMII